MGKIIDGIIAIAVGVGGALLLFFVLNWLVERLPEKWESRLKPYVFIGPALVAVGIFLLYPLLRTVFLSVFDEQGEEFVGFENFSELFGSADFRDTLINNVLWLLIVPPVVVGIGLAVATLADRLAPRGERFTKSLIFVPMAISFVGAATIWRFVYESRPEGPAADRDPERDRHEARLRARRLHPAERPPVEHAAPHGGADLAAGRVCDGAPLGCDQERPR